MDSGKASALGRANGAESAGGAADAAARVSELAFDLLPDAYLILDGQHRVTLANHRYLTLMGRSLDDIRGCSVYDINQAGSEAQREERRLWLSHIFTGLAVGETRESAPIRYVLGTSDRPRDWQIVVTCTVPDVIVVQVNDVTDMMAREDSHQRERAKLRSQARLRQVLVQEANTRLDLERDRLEQLLSFSRVGAWVFDLVSGTTDCTEQAKLNLGLDPAEPLTLSRYLDELVHPDDRPSLRSLMERAVSAQTSFEAEHRVCWPDGSEHWLLMRAAPSQVEDGQVRAIAAFSLDITARKERELRGAALAAEDRAARQHSERVREAMDQFIMTVSHELRSPLQVIMSWSTLLRTAGDARHVPPAAAAIDRSARQLSHLVDDLLDSGAIVSGRLSTHPSPLEFAAMAATVAHDMRMSAEAKGLQMDVGELTPCIVMGDESRLRQVVWNLLTNAVKFTATGRIEVSVTVEGDYASLKIRDTGAGIAPEMLDQIFERFQQAHPAQQGQRTGTAGLGLGLWLVRALTELHGGTVSARSDGPGQGATFEVKLPVCG